MARRAGPVDRVATRRDACEVSCNGAGCFHARVPDEFSQHESSDYEIMNLLLGASLLDNGQGRVIVGRIIAILIDELDVLVIAGPARCQSLRTDIDR